MNKNQELIWRYLSGNLPLQEKEAFEQELTHNSQLQEALVQEKELSGFLINKEAKNAALKNLAEIHQESIADKVQSVTPRSSKKTEDHKMPTVKSPIVRWLIPLAIAATMAIGYLFIPSNQATPQEIYATHFDPSEISFSTRGENSEAALAKVADLYNAKSYDATISLIEELPDELQSIDKIIYTKGISLVASQRHEEGRALLRTLPALYGDEVEWYRALSFLQEGKKEEAISALRAISPKFNRYEAVNAILKQL